MNNRILLIRPRNVYHYNNYPPLNLICLGSALEAAGFEVRIINAALESDPFAAIDRQLEGTLLVGISILTSEAPDAYDLVQHIRQNSDVPIAVGGWHCTLFPDQMARCDEVDYVIAGEGEPHMVAIAEALRDGRAIDRKVFPKEIIDLEALPAPDYDLDETIETFISSYLTDKCSEVITQPMRWLPYESSRGCPSRCTFCINVVTGNQRYRKKSAAKTLDEIEALVHKYRLTHVKFIDDNFFVDAKRVRTIAQGMIDRGLNVTWDGECRCDYFNDRHLNDETLAVCRQSGLVQLTLGIESGSQHTLELMKKGITPEQAANAVVQCDTHDIIARSSFILDIPGETFDDIKQTIGFINRMRKYKQFTCGVTTFRPYPRCELTDGLVAAGYLVEPEDFKGWTDTEIIDLYTSAEYIRPWQANGRYSASASVYLGMESQVRLGNHQIDRAVDRFWNNCFALSAKVRNRLRFYSLQLDRVIYTRFLKRFYRRRQELEQAGHYPLSKIAQEGTES